MTKRRHNLKSLSNRRRYLRLHLTPAETFLWKYLKGRQLKGRRFTKQHSIHHYIVDFYCASERLIIELDGEVHNDPVQMEYDAKRIKYLESLGYQVLRFENKSVFDLLPSVLMDIENSFANC